MGWTIVAGYEGSASSEQTLALARGVLDTAGGRLVVGCVYEYQPFGGRFASGELAAAVARRVCRAATVAMRTVAAVIAPVRAVAADSGKILDLVIASSYGRFRLPGFRRRQGGRWIHACRCPVLVLPESQTAARERALAVDREEAT